MKDRVLKAMEEFLARALGTVSVYCYCIMSNHYHDVGAITGDHKGFSAWKQSMHCSIAQAVNRFFKRIGPVGASRPLNVVVDDDVEAQIRVIMYVLYNPVRAGLVQNPQEWMYSAYAFYAYGKRNKYSRFLTYPQWYMDLGRTMKERRRRFRRLAHKYYVRKWVPTDEELMKYLGCTKADLAPKRISFMRSLRMHLLTGALYPSELKGVVDFMLTNQATLEEAISSLKLHPGRGADPPDYERRLDEHDCDRQLRTLTRPREPEGFVGRPHSSKEPEG